ncbi:MAG: hypothetical protein JWL73_198 [Actinomycetia bacterium]|nr:hypothetical protein [Actinomycetes bacterium]
MSLQGTLDTFSVADVLPVLERGAKTGALRVRGDTASGILHLVDGRLLGAESEALRGATASDAELRVRLLDVCFILFRERGGTFEFDTAWRPPTGSTLTGVGVDEVLDEVGRVLRAWDSVDADAGDSGLGGTTLDYTAPVALVRELAGETVTLDRHAWRVMRAIGPGSTLRDVAGALGSSVVETSVVVRGLAAAGILTLGDQDDTGPTVARRPFGSGSVSPAPFDVSAFDPASYDPAEHVPVAWPNRPGAIGNPGADALGAADASDPDLVADVAALQAAARDLRPREERWAAESELPSDPESDPSGYRPDRTSAFARLASERTEAELEAEADEVARRASFALAVEDLDLLPGSARDPAFDDLAEVDVDPGGDPAGYDPSAYEAADFDPDAYLPLSFDGPAPTSPATNDLEHVGLDLDAAVTGFGPPSDPPEGHAAEVAAEGSDDDSGHPDDEGEPDAPDARDARDARDAPDAPRVGEPRDRGALLRMFSALREG